MPGVIENWPAWKEFGIAPDEITQGKDFASAKAEIIAQYGEEALRQGWLRVCKDLEAVTEKLSALGSDSIPIFQMKEICHHGLSDEQSAQLKSSGCCVVRGVIPEAEADALFQDMKNLVAENPGKILGWPPESPSMLRLYNSPTQVAVRTHPNQILLQRTLNALFHDESNETSPEPLSYTDAARIRPPGQAFLGLGPHIDAGSLCRWTDLQYRKVYDSIFSGNPEKHDAFDLSVRKNADQFFFKANAHSVVFRSFQGWTALTPTSPSAGTLMLYPNISSVIAYVLLRPFFSPPKDEKDIMDATKWTFDPESDWFPGTMKEQSQRLSLSSHPHLRLRECLTYIPVMKQGDTVFWHTDMCHAVDPEHNGEGDASVVYVAACPTTAINKAYIKTQLQAALLGKGPPDSPNVDIDERNLKGYKGFVDISPEGKTVLGFDLL
ncbi:DUF1479-domain-containing protein [Annulohypoxylon maeteangense]|uniref:DUF1479-domain-containing protein n=1 Tax=Annulohypoxylon maeteangense TaxID=1927788 RepID=UPI0020077372|nr:DUF1479-domain-containing protein [Annulohypoxylon maeteangense]KAI0882881.1 DUF1479-domain-containing protein [Annulohypoxylon maeteangense]